ncbi:unnamed protein product [Prorocentrum cordatum]|uniref:Uncharacterized protein n=1 Tax=Prorocentrum cordatum TaxID=2364126 RepID=A0ABN9V3M9_9DINO|nr:unnamed protein product [Polarella glacialis]
MCRALLGLGPSRYARGLATRRPPQRLEEDVAQRLLELREVKPCVAWQWGRYCADEGGGDQDPLRHGESFIREFLAREAAGRLPAVRLATPAMVKRLRRFQRQGGAEATRAWHDYARTEGLGIKDPRLNAAELVQRFLDGRAGGAQGSGLGPGAVEGEPRRWGSPAVLKGLRVALVPPARRLGVPSGGEASEPQAWGPDGLPWDAAPAASYAEQLEQKVQRAVGLFLEAGAAMPERLRVYESARRHYRTRAYFDVELSAGALAYRKGAMRLRSDARCAPSLNRALKVVRDRALRSESLRRGLHQVFVHTSAGGDAIAMLSYRGRLPEGWRAAASAVHEEEALPVCGYAFSPAAAGGAHWATREGRAVCGRDSLCETFQSGGRSLVYEQAISHGALAAPRAQGWGPGGNQSRMPRRPERPPRLIGLFGLQGLSGCCWAPLSPLGGRTGRGPSVFSRSPTPRSASE